MTYILPDDWEITINHHMVKPSRADHGIGGNNQQHINFYHLSPRLLKEQTDMITIIIDFPMEHDTDKKYQTQSLMIRLDHNRQQVSLSFNADKIKNVSEYDNDLQQLIQESESIGAFLTLSFIHLLSQFDYFLERLDKRRETFQDEFNDSNKIKSHILNDIWTVKNALVYLETSIQRDIDIMRNALQEENINNLIEPAYREKFQIAMAQTEESAHLLVSVIDNISDSYSARNEYNLNRSMKILTMYSILLTIPTIVTGFFGQNVLLPLADLNISWVITILINVVLIGLGLYIFKKIGYFE